MIHKRTLKLWEKIIISIFIFSGMLFSLLKIYLNYLNDEKNKRKEVIYSASINRNSNYKVHLYDNNFVNSTEMKSDQVYISDLVKDIDLSLIYVYSGTDKANLKYTYDITALLSGTNNNSDTGKDELVWKKDYILLEKKKGTTNDASFNVIEDLNIDFPTYNNEVNDFKKRFGMNLNTSLKITLNINITGKYKNYNINKDDTVEIEIPLGIQAFSLKNQYEKQSNYKVYNNDKLIVPTKYTLRYSITFTIFLLLSILLYKPIFDIKSKTFYETEINKILRLYGQIIVEVETPVKETDLTVQMVKNFEELVDLEEEVRVPIILYESSIKKIATFTVTYNNIIYKYVVKEKTEE